MSASTDPASGGSPVLLRSGPPSLPEAGGGPRQREDGDPGDRRRGRRAEPRAGAERHSCRSRGGSSAPQLAAGKNNDELCYEETQPSGDFDAGTSQGSRQESSSASGSSATRRLDWFHRLANPERMYNRDVWLGNVHSKSRNNGGRRTLGKTPGQDRLEAQGKKLSKVLCDCRTVWRNSLSKKKTNFIVLNAGGLWRIISNKENHCR